MLTGRPTAFGNTVEVSTWEAKTSQALQFLADQPLIAIGIVMLLGAALGNVSIGGVSLGSAGILFAAIGLAAAASAWDVNIAIPEPVGFLGLALFALATGIISGPGFFEALRSSWPLMLAVAAVILAGALVTLGVGRLLGLDSETIAGVFAGSQTNTPALAAAGGSSAATIGYACAYIFGVLGMLAATAATLGRRGSDTDAPQPLVDVTIRVDRVDPILAEELGNRFGAQVKFVRLRRSGEAEIIAVGDGAVFGHGDLVSVVGPSADVDGVVGALGHRSTHDLTSDRAHLDFRRITLSNPRHSGHTVSDLHLGPRYGATVSRVRRGDVDLISAPDLKLHLGDRLRVVAPPEQMAAITALLGDSSRGMTALVPVALGGGLALGLAIGLIPIPLPGGLTVTVGSAAGALLVGLVMGRVRRIGRLITTMPLTSAAVIADIGLMLFLAYAGCKAGSMIGTAFGSGAVFNLVVTGAAATTVVAVGTYVLARWVFKLGGVRSAGIHAGVQTQPAILGFANERTGHDPRVSLGYALVYPTAMIVKVVAAQLLVSI